jgi:peptidoglycan/LPS O-acetylase OafA/YrhL
MAAVLIPRLGWNTFAYPANPVAWTLAWELIVNILYAAGLWRARGRTLLALIVPLVAGAVVVSFASPSGWSFGMTGLGIGLGGLRALPEFLIGALLFRAYRAGLLARLPLVTPPLLFLAWGCLAVLPQGTPPLLDATIAILIHPLLLALLVRGEGVGHAWFGWLGDISYPLYASHLAPIWVAWYTPWLGLDRGPDPLRACGVVLLALGLAWGIYRLADPAAKSRKSAGSRGDKAALAACDPVPKSV